MHIYFIGIGGTAIGPLAMISHQFGAEVSGSDKQNSQYIDYLKKRGISEISIGSDSANISQLNQQKPIDWVVHSSAVSIENPNHPEIMFAKEQGIKVTKRDELLNHILEKSGQKLIAIAGTHGKTTTTAMAVWVFKQLGLPISYSVGAKIPFGEMGHFEPASNYFVLEADEFDRNFLAFNPYMSLITGVDWDHHEIFPTRENYQEAFQTFMKQSQINVVWQNDQAANNFSLASEDVVIDDSSNLLNTLSIVGEVNRRDALQVATALGLALNKPIKELLEILERFPGLSRRFEKLIEGLYTDYAHTAPKIAGCLQLAKEISKDMVVVYEPLTNRRQHYIKDDYLDLFQGVKKLYWVPSYLAREDPDQTILTPSQLIEYMANKEVAEPAQLNENLKNAIQSHLSSGDLVVCLTGGGGGSLDEWLRQEFVK